MLKRVFATVLSAAFFATATAAVVIAPVNPAVAEMAAKEKTKAKDKSGMSFNERRKKCGAEWKEAKAAGKTSNWKWPKFWSDCNKRLKAGT
jgi:Skp family chaperone for outer membrane proteins